MEVLKNLSVISYLFKDALDKSDYISLSYYMRYEVEIMWKEVVVADVGYYPDGCLRNSGKPRKSSVGMAADRKVTSQSSCSERFNNYVGTPSSVSSNLE
jgi:hypothetical protein